MVMIRVCLFAVLRKRSPRSVETRERERNALAERFFSFLYFSFSCDRRKLARAKREAEEGETKTIAGPLRHDTRVRGVFAWLSLCRVPLCRGVLTGAVILK